MQIEIRADNTAHISGYVNAVQRESRAVITPHGKVNEEIEPGVFADAINRAESVPMTVDHAGEPVASTADGSLQIKEDAIGLRAEADITDQRTVEAAKAGHIRGWSFGMRNVVDEVEQRADKLPLRKIKKLDLDHITLVINKMPVYAATSVEVRAEDESELEMRCTDTEISVDQQEPKPEPVDYTVFEKTIKFLEVAK